MIYLLGYVVAKINQDVSVQRSMVWQLTSVVWCFFDLDGTLHQQDMFGSFLRYLLRRQPLNALLVSAVVADHSHCVIDKRSCGTLADESASVGMHFWSQ
ncbi:HAD hydrolase YfhB [Escherichia coli]|uniref:HAD hydrolase YfhB n=1 Tax=Escherichia coli TaxID=562 RepID=A0A377ALI8_ECOLX|nr:HAD hydrolase YfhB [Escherichia coli]